MKKVSVLLILITIILAGCTTSDDREAELEVLIETYTDSLLSEDVETQKKIVQESVMDVESALKGIDFISVETTSKSINGNEAVVDLRTDLVEHQDNEDLRLIGLITLKIIYGDSGWMITDIETAVDPSTPRPPQT
ncbi:hypothetical protein PAT3040_02942 [Paenibacillus agaridevorans]|uniref:DUF4878 domain-containing protein n=1 Tax=Paenibacillus agaridevorans TaxID=171404 RepID=A0A2R5ENX4_9BACL|nr:hypothetical protein [Paenibacillus agaridevorans]GBG08362.1 hypothetical protein PAT3040_02942 [Paenibacillus agaridevorans]